MGKILQNVLMVILLFVLIGCSTAGSTPGPTLTAEANGYRMEMTFAQPPMLNQSVQTTLRFYYQDAPISVENVVCDLQMPGMVMGSMRPIADPQTDGSHLVNLLFTMDGEWSIVVTADSDDGPIRLYVEGLTITPDPDATQSPAQE